MNKIAILSIILIQCFVIIYLLTKIKYLNNKISCLSNKLNSMKIINNSIYGKSK